MKLSNILRALPWLGIANLALVCCTASFGSFTTVRSLPSIALHAAAKAAYSKWDRDWYRDFVCDPEFRYRDFERGRSWDFGHNPLDLEPGYGYEDDLLPHQIPQRDDAQTPGIQPPRSEEGLAKQKDEARQGADQPPTAEDTAEADGDEAFEPGENREDPRVTEQEKPDEPTVDESPAEAEVAKDEDAKESEPGESQMKEETAKQENRDEPSVKDAPAEAEVAKDEDAKESEPGESQMKEETAKQENRDEPGVKEAPAEAEVAKDEDAKESEPGENRMDEDTAKEEAPDEPVAKESPVEAEVDPVEESNRPEPAVKAAVPGVGSLPQIDATRIVNAIWAALVADVNEATKWIRSAGQSLPRVAFRPALPAADSDQGILEGNDALDNNND